MNIKQYFKTLCDYLLLILYIKNFLHVFKQNHAHNIRSYPNETQLLCGSYTVNIFITI